MNQEIFRTYDIRGIAETDLTSKVIEQIGRAYGTFLPPQAEKIALGMDVRVSSERIKEAFVNGLLSTGISIVDFGEIPTPLLYFAVHYHNMDGGVQITGSHNPKEYNGLKILSGKETIYGEDIQQLRKLIENGIFRKGQGASNAANIVDEYLKYILDRVEIGKKRLKVIFDSGNGTSGPVVRKLFSKIPCDFDILFEEPDGTFPNHLADPTVPKFLTSLIDTVRDSGADMGIGFDGDADRIGAIDEMGRIIWGDKLLGIYAKGIIERNPGAKVICEVKCSNGLLEFVRDQGGTPLMWKTGHSLIKAKMKEQHAPIAGEMSGHMFFADNYFGFDDAIFAALRLVEILSNTNSPLSALVDEIPSYFATPEIRIDCPDAEKFKVVRQIRDEFRRTNEILDIDGVRVNFPNGWGLLRASNTQPILVLRFEATSEKILHSIVGTFRQALSNFEFIDTKQLSA